MLLKASGAGLASHHRGQAPHPSQPEFKHLRKSTSSLTLIMTISMAAYLATLWDREVVVVVTLAMLSEGVV